MTYFNNCETLDDVKALYRTLAKENHPDKGGDTATMQAINSEYAYAIRKIAIGAKLSDEDIQSEILKAEAYQEAVNKAVNLEGCKLELLGTWLWITGETKQHKDILKADPARFIWAKKKSDMSAWFFRTEEYKTRNRDAMQLDDIRNKFGSQTITSHTKKIN